MKQSLRSWLWAVPIEQEIDEEILFHLEMHTRDLIAGGMDPRTAREVAASRLGDIRRLKRTCVDLGRKRDREMRLVQWLDEFRDDVRFAVRQLRRSPGFTVVAAVTLALGIGANSAIFALADAALLRPLPFPESDRLVMIHEIGRPGNPLRLVGPYEVVDWAARNRTVDSMAGIMLSRRVMTVQDGAGEEVGTQTVSARFFDVFRVAPIGGRTFLPSDDHADADAAVISERLWRGRFGGDPGVIGRQIKLDRDPFTVVGIVPASFQVLASSDVWTIMTTAFMRNPVAIGHYIRAVGRLSPGVTLARAQADMTVVADALAKERPDRNKDHGVLLEPLQPSLVGADLQLTAKLLLGVVAFVLLTCCANIANLMLARTSGRARELAVRSALGAGGRRIARLLMTESLVLSAMAAALGAALGAAILAAAPSLVPPGVLPIDVTLAFDARVLAFCAVAAFGLAFAFGAFPAWQAARLPPVQAMGAGGRTSTGGGSAFRSVLAMGQVAAAVVLLCGAGLLLRSLSALMHVDAGYRPSELLTMQVGVPFVRPDAPPGTPYATIDARRQFFDDVEREVRSAPGVRDVTWGSALPLDGFWIGYTFEREGDPRQRPEAQRDISHFMHVGPAYFETLGIKIVAGRPFTNLDTLRSQPVCIVNETLVRRYFGNQSPLGARLTVRGWTSARGPLHVREIVGVIRDVRERPDEADAAPQIYVPFWQDPPNGMSLIVRPSAGSAAAITPAVRAAIARVDKERPLTNVRTIATISYEANAAARFRAVVIGAFALLVLTLAVVGVFGVLAYSVQQRVREFGVRIALGATTRNVLLMVFGGTIRIIAAGLVVGLAAAAILGRSISSFLFGVRPVDPLTFAGVAALLAVTAALAMAVPALRAARVDPVIALRNE
jgi:putative ABC transport system permease protein